MTTTLTPPSVESHFRAYEPTLHQIISRYPSGSELTFSGAARSTVRQNLKTALENYLLHPSIVSPISRQTASIVLREFVFSDSPGNKVYVGPKRPARRAKSIALANADAPTADLEPINCSDAVTAHAILHLKNFNHIQLPVTLTNFNPAHYPNLETQYPNVELIPTQTADTFTLL